MGELVRARASVPNSIQSGGAHHCSIFVLGVGDVMLWVGDSTIFFSNKGKTW